MRLAHLIGPEIRDLLRDNPEEVRDLLEEVHPEDLADVVLELSDGRSGARCCNALLPTRRRTFSNACRRDAKRRWSKKSVLVRSRGSPPRCRPMTVPTCSPPCRTTSAKSCSRLSNATTPRPQRRLRS